MRYLLYLFVIVFLVGCGPFYIGLKIHDDATVDVNGVFTETNLKNKLCNTDVLMAIDTTRRGYVNGFKLQYADSVGEYLGDDFNPKFFVFKYSDDSLEIKTSVEKPLKTVLQKDSLLHSFSFYLKFDKNIEEVHSSDSMLQISFLKKKRKIDSHKGNEVRLFWKDFGNHVDHIKNQRIVIYLIEPKGTQKSS